MQAHEDGGRVEMVPRSMMLSLTSEPRNPAVTVTKPKLTVTTAAQRWRDDARRRLAGRRTG
jgi:hypothetical protein